MIHQVLNLGRCADCGEDLSPYHLGNLNCRKPNSAATAVDQNGLDITKH